MSLKSSGQTLISHFDFNSYSRDESNEINKAKTNNEITDCFQYKDWAFWTWLGLERLDRRKVWFAGVDQHN